MTLHFLSEIPDSQQYLLKFMFIILNNFRCGLLANKNDFHISTIQTIEKLSEFITFQARKTTLSFTLFISLRFHAPSETVFIHVIVIVYTINVSSEIYNLNRIDLN